MEHEHRSRAWKLTEWVKLFDSNIVILLESFY